MGKQHDTMQNEPQEAPVQPQKPEVQQPDDPRTADIPQEAPNIEPQEVPQQPEVKPEQPGSTLNKTEV